MSIFKACDIRGIVTEEWNVADARRIGRSLGAMLQRRRESSICVGGDFRRSTPELLDAVATGLSETGVQVISVGQQATPIVYFAARRSACPNVAIVTASHNPGKYNGVKFMVAGQPATPDLITELRQGLDTQSTNSTPTTPQSSEILNIYQQWVVQSADKLVPTDNAPTQFRLVLDAMGGAFTHIAHQVLHAASYDTTAIDDQLDPDYATRDPNPAADKNLVRVIDTVAREQADIGIALDGDGDRVIFVDDRGQITRPEQIAAMLIRNLFHQCTTVYDLKCASIVANATHAEGGRAIMQPSGHGFIKSTMLKERAEIGVEVSGHHFFGVLNGGDDGLFTALVVLRLMQKTGKTLHELLEPIGWPAITPDIRVHFTANAEEAVESIASHCGGTVSRLDGVRAEYEDGSWALARASITEPAITFRFEGRDSEHLRVIADTFLANHPDLKRQVKERIND